MLYPLTLNRQLVPAGKFVYIHQMSIKLFVNFFYRIIPNSRYINMLRNIFDAKVITKFGWSWCQCHNWSLDGVIVRRWFSFSLCAVPPKSFFILIYKRVGVRVRVGKNGEMEGARVTKCRRGSRMIELSKLIFKLEKYKLYYLFKYLKSMAESSSIVIMDCT